MNDFDISARRAARQAAIVAYAEEMAGSRFDLDTELEAAGIEHLVDRFQDMRASKPSERLHPFES